MTSPGLPTIEQNGLNVIGTYPLSFPRSSIALVAAPSSQSLTSDGDTTTSISKKGTNGREHS
jgi:hypothetical protein